MGFVVLGLLSLLAFFAAVCVAVRFYDESRAELALSACLYFVGLIVVPVHLLGWIDSLYPLSLALSSLGLSSGVVAAGIAGELWQIRLRAAGRAMIRIAALPWQAAVWAFRARSIAFVGVVGVVGILVWTAWLTWLAPHGSWDGLVYHEPMVNYAIQYNGFALVDVPRTPAVQQVNSAPRVPSCVSVWLVIFTDRRLVELRPHLFSLLLLLGFYVLTCKLTERRLDALGLTAALFFVPAIALQLRSLYTDADFVGVLLAAFCYVLRTKLRLVDLLTAALALGLVGGTKHTGIVFVPIYGVILLWRWRAGARTRGRFWAAGVCAVVIIGALMLPTYLRNTVTFGNPIWPRRVSSETLDLHLKGLHNPNLRDKIGRVRDLFRPPIIKRQFLDTKDNGYGNAFPFVVLPLAAIALVLIPVRLGGWLIRRRGPPSARLRRIALIALPCMVVLSLSPSFLWARYNGYAIAAAMALVLWLLGREKWRDLSQVVVGIMVILGLITLSWSDPGWCVPAKTAFELARKGTVERTQVSLPMSNHLAGRLGQLHHAEIGEGDVVAYTFCRFPADLWNEAISNTVVYTPASKNGEDFLARLDELRVEWIFVKANDRGHRILDQYPDSWEQIPVEKVTPHFSPVVFRRRPVASKSGGASPTTSRQSR